MRERPSDAAGEFIERDGAEKQRLNFISHFLPTFEAFLLVKLISSEDRGLAVKSVVEDSRHLKRRSLRVDYSVL